jgi:predicted  nucleic acid-binding Zn-ribbon protein
MLPQIEQLLILQDRDQKIKAISAELGTVPLERQRIDQLLASRAGAFETVKQRTKELEVKRKGLELEAQTRREAIARYKTQQFQTRKNEEFQALGKEIDRLGREIQEIEDREIELMEQSDRAAREVAAVDAEFRAAKAQADQQLAALKSKEEVLQARLEETTMERDQLAAQIDGDLLFRYNRLFQSKGGDAVVPVEHEVCMGCHMKNTSATVHRVKMAIDIVHCEQCGRMLY